MLTPLQLPGIIPAGAGVELVDDDDPILMRCPLLIEGSLGETRDAGLAWPRARRSWAGTSRQPVPGFTDSWTMSAGRRINVRDPGRKSTWRPLTGADPGVLCPEDLWAVSRETGLFGAILAGDDIKDLA